MTDAAEIVAGLASLFVGTLFLVLAAHGGYCQDITCREMPIVLAIGIILYSIGLFLLLRGHFSFKTIE